MLPLPAVPGPTVRSRPGPGRAVLALVLLGLLAVACGSAAPRVTDAVPTASAAPTASAPTATPAPSRLPRLTSSGAGIGSLDAAAGRIPVSVSLARVHLAGHVSPVGLGPDGTLGIPPDPVTVGWWQHGAVPGDPGVALLAAHVDYDKVEGVFFRLAQVRVGDVVVVGAADGGQSRWRVVRRVQTSKQQLPVASLTRSSGAPTLVLVTCGGSFDPAKHSYRDNVLVYAVAA